MNKKVLLVSLIVVLVVAAVALVTSGLYANTIVDKNIAIGDVVGDEEMALKLGRVILEEHLPSAFDGSEITLAAEDRGDVWRVHNVIDRVQELENGDTMVIYGGGIRVDIRKSNGAVVAIGLDD